MDQEGSGFFGAGLHDKVFIPPGGMVVHPCVVKGEEGNVLGTGFIEEAVKCFYGEVPMCTIMAIVGCVFPTLLRVVCLHVGNQILSGDDSAPEVGIHGMRPAVGALL
jgi:hypothetical protein